MSKTLKLIIYLAATIVFCQPVFAGQDAEYPVWLAPYYDCSCYGGEPSPREACHDRIDPANFRTEPSSHQTQVNWATQVLRAKSLLEVSASNAVNSEQRSCLYSALSVLKSTLGFMMREIQSGHPDSPTLVKALYQSGRFTYNWATSHCLPGQGEPPPLGIDLPNPGLCKPF